MGANMARRLSDQGFPVAAVFDVNQEAAKTLAQELGCEAAAELKQVTKLSDVIITVVTDDKAMKGIYTGGLLHAAAASYSSIAPPFHPQFTSGSSKRRPRPARNRWKPAWPRASRRRAKERFI